MVSSSFDQSFCLKTLAQVLHKRDFLGVNKTNQTQFREELLMGALRSANSSFDYPFMPLASFPLRGKTVFKLVRHQDELVERKLICNLKSCASIYLDGRDQIVKKLKLLLEEGVPYRIYRLDIKAFYESFRRCHVVDVLSKIKGMSPQSGSLMECLLEVHEKLGGEGIPRGLSVSAFLSEVLMQDFDQKVRWDNDVFYYSRFVDDIIIVSSTRENHKDFLTKIEKFLPPGLELNPTKKSVVEILSKVKADASKHAPVLLKFDYLGYEFLVKNPTKQQAGKVKDADLLRVVHVDVAQKKIKKIKTRIVRSFLSYSKTGDWELLRDRLTFLTHNFSVYNPKAGGKKIAGIFYSYPLVAKGADGLRELDRFLRCAVLAKKGRSFPAVNAKLTGKQRRQLLANSFERGHSNRSFVHFSATRIAQIQSCWIY